MMTRPIVCFAFLFSIIASANAQSFKPCPQYPSIIDDYSPQKANYHIYSVPDMEIVDLKEYPKATRALVFQVLLSNSIAVAPVLSNGPIGDCNELDVAPFGKIVTKIDGRRFTVTNYTLPDHYLANGKVTRHILQVGSKIVVRTSGVGNNRNPFWKAINGNQTLANYIWTGPNFQLKVKTIEMLKAQQEDGPQNIQPVNDVPTPSQPINAYRPPLVKAAIGFFHWYNDVWSKKIGNFNLVRNKNGQPYKEGECPCQIDVAGANAMLSFLNQYRHILAPQFFEGLRKTIQEAGTKLKTTNVTLEAERAVEELYVQGPNIIMTQDYPDFQRSGFYDEQAKWSIMVLSDIDALVDTPSIMWNGKRSHYTLNFTKVGNLWLLTGPITFID